MIPVAKKTLSHSHTPILTHDISLSLLSLIAGFVERSSNSRNFSATKIGLQLHRYTLVRCSGGHVEADDKIRGNELWEKKGIE